jgi:hypothetical protein
LPARGSHQHLDEAPDLGVDGDIRQTRGDRILHEGGQVIVRAAAQIVDVLPGGVPALWCHGHAGTVGNPAGCGSPEGDISV